MVMSRVTLERRWGKWLFAIVIATNAQTYLAIDDSPSWWVPGQRDDTIDELERACEVAGRADEQVLVAAAPVPDVQELAVNIRVRGILQLEREAPGDIVRQHSSRRDGAR